MRGVKQIFGCLAAVLFCGVLNAAAPQYPEYYSEFFEGYARLPLGSGLFGNYTFLGGVSDNLVDENGDGVADYLSIKVKFYFPEYGKYNLRGYLTDNTGKLFARAVTNDNLDAGENIIELRFDTKLLSTYGKNGVFYLKGLDLGMVDKWGDGVRIGGIVDAYATKSYTLDGLPLQAVLFTGENFSDRGIDTNGNGLYEQIEVVVEAKINRAGEYIITASTDCLHGETKKFLQTGKQKIAVPLDTRYAIWMRCRNTLVLTTVGAYDINDNRITSMSTNYTLKTQGFDKFEKPVVFIDETTFKDYLFYSDKTKKADFIAIDVDILVDTAGKYIVEYDVVDKDGNVTIDMKHIVELEKGKRRLYLSIPADPFYQAKKDGPYYIKFFTIKDANRSNVDSLQSFMYKTKAYKWSSLEPFNRAASTDENGGL
jgi:hypothetical protein